MPQKKDLEATIEKFQLTINRLILEIISLVLIEYLLELECHQEVDKDNLQIQDFTILRKKRGLLNHQTLVFMVVLLKKCHRPIEVTEYQT